MWYWIIKVSILSFILIFLLHYLYSFFLSTLTVPKIKDLVTLPQEKYDKMFHSLQSADPSDNNGSNNGNNNGSNNGNNNGNNNGSNNNTQSMKEDLINFLKDIGSKPQASSNTSAFGSLDENVSSFSFSR
jgi:hypothetical protein